MRSIQRRRRYDVRRSRTALRAREHRHYSNVGYRAVGVALEAVTGERYGDLVQQRGSTAWVARCPR